MHYMQNHCESPETTLAGVIIGHRSVNSPLESGFQVFGEQTPQLGYMPRIPGARQGTRLDVKIHQKRAERLGINTER